MNDKVEVKRISHKDFVLKAIETRPHPELGKGIHSTYSGFSTAFKDYYGTDANVVEACQKLVTEGVIVTRPTRGGVVIYLASDAPASKNGNGSAALKRMGLA